MSQSRKSFIRLLSSVGRYPAHWMFLVLAAIVFLKMLIHVAFYLPAFTEVGYGDAYIFFDVISFVRTGVIYRDLNQAPYLPTNYGPLLYSTLSLPYFMGASASFVPARIIELISFIACILMAASVARKLYPHPLIFPVSVATAFSVDLFTPWLLQLRGDFPAITFGLLAIRLLMNQKPASIVLAGAVAGVACGFKQSYIAAILAGAIWLLARRKPSYAARYVLASSGVIALIYGLAWVTNPQMPRHFAMLSTPLLTRSGYLGIFGQFGVEPVLLAAIAFLCVGWWWRFAKLWLVILYGIISLSISAAGALQVGANTNYYHETLFAAVPLTAVFALQLLRQRGLTRSASTLVAAVLSVYVILPLASNLYTMRKLAVLIIPRSPIENNLVKLGWALQGQHIFSVVPRIATMDPAPALTEPFLGGFLQTQGRWDPEPLLLRIRRQEFDVAVLAKKPMSFRGISTYNSTLKNSVDSAYLPYCELDVYSILLPKGGKTSAALTDRLEQIGCKPGIREPI